MSLNNKKPKVEVVLPPSGAGIDSGSVAQQNKLDLKNQKQILKNKLNELKQQQKATSDFIKLVQKDLNKLSKPTAVNKTNKTTPSKKKDVKVVKKGRNKLNGKK